MRILFCCEFYAPSVGGIQEVMRQIAERFVARGHEVTVATSCLPDRSCWTLNGVAIKDFPISGNLAKGMQGDIVAYQQWVISGEFDLVMINMAQQWTLDGLIPVLRNIRSRKIFIPCGLSCLYEPFYALYYRGMPEVLRQFDCLIFHATDYRDIHLARQCGIDRLAIIPNGASEKEFAVSADPAFRSKLGIAENELMFLTVGAFTADKGFADLLYAYLKADFNGQSSVLVLNANAYIAEATARSSAPHINTSGAHARPWRDSLKEIPRRIANWFVLNKDMRNRLPFREEVAGLIERIHTAQPRKRVTVTDLPRPDLVQAYMHADLFVFASHIEYSPLVLFESAAAGTPFLSAQVGNANEVAQWTGAGVIAPSSIDDKGYTRIDVARFAECWSQLAQDRPRLCELGRTGRSNWAARFTWEQVSQEYEDIFRQVCAAS